jgi:hypothetical protein
MKAAIEKIVKEYATYISPLHTNINQIKWRNDALGASETSPLSTIPGSETGFVSWEGDVAVTDEDIDLGAPGGMSDAIDPDDEDLGTFYI